MCNNISLYVFVYMERGRERERETQRQRETERARERESEGGEKCKLILWLEIACPKQVDRPGLVPRPGVKRHEGDTNPKKMVIYW